MGRGFRFDGPRQPSGEVNLKFGIDSTSTAGQFACNPFGPPNPSGQSRQSGRCQLSSTSFPLFGNTNAAFPPPPPGFDISAPTSFAPVVYSKLEPQDAAEDQEAKEPDGGANGPTDGDGDEDGATESKQQLIFAFAIAL